MGLSKCQAADRSSADFAKRSERLQNWRMARRSLSEGLTSLNPARAVLNCVEEHLHDRRTSPSPFEFGEIRQRDRIAARPVLAKCHGSSLSEVSEPLLVMRVDEKHVDATPIAAAAFANIRSGFNNSWRLFQPGGLCGFLTDSPGTNGLAWRVHPGEEVYGLAVTAGTLIGTVTSAYRLLCVPAVEPHVAVGGTINASSEWLGIPDFSIPGSKQRRDIGVRYASYGLYAVFLHELAHVLRGHLNYVVQGDAHFSLDEQHVPSTFEQKRLRLYVETDADDVAGRMLAKLALKPYLGNDLLGSPEGRQTAFDLLVGVTLTFSGFRAVKDCYHSGALRAYVFMAAVMQECGVDPKHSARWLEERVSAIQELMLKCGILGEDAPKYSAQEAQELLHSTLPAVRQAQLEWLDGRPFKTASPVVP